VRAARIARAPSNQSAARRRFGDASEPDGPLCYSRLPLRIYALDDRGHQFVAAAVTAVMMTITLAVLLAFSRIRTRANYR
jgi:hypothetical protein